MHTFYHFFNPKSMISHIYGLQKQITYDILYNVADCGKIVTRK